MRKYVLGLMTLLLGLCGCQHAKPTLHIYYSKVCANCQELEQSLLPKLQQEDIQIVMHDIDVIDTKEHYLATLDKLENVDENLKEDLIVPFIALEGHFGMVGYSSSMDEIIIQLIRDAIHDQELSLPSGSWLYKKG